MVLNGLNDDFGPVPPDEAQPLIAGLGLSAEDKYLIHVGWDLARKNRRTVLEAFIALQERAAASGTEAPVQQLLFVGPELAPEMAELAPRARCRRSHQDGARRLARAAARALRKRDRAALPLAAGRLRLADHRSPGLRLPGLHLRPAADERDRRRGAVYVDPNDPAAIAAAIEQAAPRFEADAPARPRQRHPLHRGADGIELRGGLSAGDRRTKDQPVKKLLALAVVLLPWALKRRVLRRFWGYQIADGARIGLSYVFPGHLVMGEGATSAISTSPSTWAASNAARTRSSTARTGSPATRRRAPISRTAPIAIRPWRWASTRPSPSSTSSTAPTASTSAPSPPSRATTRS